MPTGNQEELTADQALIDAQIQKMRAETAAIHQAAEREQHRLGGFVIEGIKVLGAVVIGAGGAVAGFSGYQLSEVKKEQYQLAADKARTEEKGTREKIDQLKADLNAKKQEAAILDKDLAAGRANLDQITRDLAKVKSGNNPPAIVAALTSATANASQLSERLASASNSSGDIQRSGVGNRLYYVIASTSTSRESADAEVQRVKKKLGDVFNDKFPTIEVYGPATGPYTILISRDALPLSQASQLKQQAIEAGFSKETWLWQSSVSYFEEKKPRN